MAIYPPWRCTSISARSGPRSPGTQVDAATRACRSTKAARRDHRPADLDLLRRFEPVVKFTYGELFFPTGVEGYLAECDLFVGCQPARATAPRATGRADRREARQLHRAAGREPLPAARPEAPGRAWIWRAGTVARTVRPSTRPAGSPASGSFARLVDAGFTASLLLRGTVPGGTAAAAQIKYERARAADPRYIYHGRVIRQDGWLVLHYMWFYFMNDFRSTFSGANDHEADWEQAFIYLEEPPGRAAAGLDRLRRARLHGDDLRRRWDDPLLVKEGDHPVLHAGAGSHASYFEQGEYLTIVPLPALRGVKGLLSAMRDSGATRSGNRTQAISRRPSSGPWRCPSSTTPAPTASAIGPGQAAEWTPRADRRLDRLGGRLSRAVRARHARPFRRRAGTGRSQVRPDGTVRQSWNDPVGFAGLSKVAPPYRLPERLAREARSGARRSSGKPRPRPAGGRGASRRSTPRFTPWRSTPRWLPIHAARAAELAAAEASLSQKRSEVARLRDTVEALELELERVEHGDIGSPTAHLRHAMHPMPPEETRYGRLVEVWSAVSISVLLLAEVFMLLTGIVPWYRPRRSASAATSSSKRPSAGA